MSYILDALKKMEHEKAKKKGAAGIASVSGELFRPEKLKPQKGTIWKIGVAITLVAILTSGATWYLLRDNKSAKTAKAVPPVQVPPAPQVQPQEAAVPPVAAPVTTPAPVATLPAQPPAPPVVARPEMPVAANVAPPSAEGEESRRASRRNSAKASQRKNREDSLPAQVGTAPTDIKVSGIAWQDERTARRAVVNGFLLKEGSVVGGAKIVEILPEKVRFSMSGNTFELSMHSTAVAGAAK